MKTIQIDFEDIFTRDDKDNLIAAQFLNELLAEIHFSKLAFKVELLSYFFSKKYIKEFLRQLGVSYIVERNLKIKSASERLLLISPSVFQYQGTFPDKEKIFNFKKWNER